MISVAVTGSRELGSRTREDVIGAFSTFLLPFARLGARWVLGGAAGIDTMVLDWLTGLPPTLAITAEYDPLRDDGEHYARAIRSADGHADRRRYDGMIHGFFQMTGLVSVASQVQADIAAWISEQTGPPASGGAAPSTAAAARTETAQLDEGDHQVDDRRAGRDAD